MALSTGLKVIFLLQAAIIVLGNIEMRPLESKTLEGFECISNNDIIIQFINNTSNETKTFAECSTDLEGCYLTEQSFGNKYAVFYTGSGGKVYITTFVDKSHGSYRCCEKYDGKRCFSTEFVTENTTSNNSAGDMPQQITICSDNIEKQTEDDYLFRVGISTTLGFIFVMNVILVWPRMKGCITWDTLLCGKCKRQYKQKEDPTNKTDTSSVIDFGTEYR